jgi:hypothetical protein
VGVETQRDTDSFGYHKGNFIMAEGAPWLEESSGMIGEPAPSFTITWLSKGSISVQARTQLSTRGPILHRPSQLKGGRARRSENIAD